MKKFLFLLIILIMLQPIQSFALSCAGPEPVEEAFERYDGVIVGTVDKIFTKNKGMQVVLVKVSKSFKGVKQNWIFVEEDTSWGDRSREGEEYLYFLRDKRGDWENSLCSQTRHMNKAKDDLNYLNQLETIQLEQVDKPDDPFLDWPKVGGVSALTLIFVGLIFKIYKHYK
ncbi:hypothetical protein E3U55_08345 [Filobacillus milosensis]|uniref:CbiN domain protein n=1 Tax=Filobacillus milosensis TaxID=94137 RepID=A0A4Y8IN57_9BACI|nr:hypothetical protein [Filobacillus milosensis]TFB21822.1 hypothetical protein E3U55_08345 [Filobacillus milosensis]